MCGVRKVYELFRLERIQQVMVGLYKDIYKLSSVLQHTMVCTKYTISAEHTQKDTVTCKPVAHKV